ncbi:putative alpha-N-acetylglucosaminidase [Rhizodiscina lignyota]|uniref:Alpha-N-acetylglucosaminidase n=1 Tax=Rhizodiscina lignyota TaxID=1504668 RepID=A0A9P4IMP2_9PEZI|nr:putative alpha-N-acetylglucosaminidase [Rhizodiscina lignyota]
MNFFFLFGVIAFLGAVQCQSVQGIYNLVARRLPQHRNNFDFCLTDFGTHSNSNQSEFDQYLVTSGPNGKIKIEGSTLSAISVGLHRYLTDVLKVDIYWYVGSQLNHTPSKLPHLGTPLRGASTVPWRYHFNTVTFSYTAAFWSWEDWELELDWLALRGVNLPLAWNGNEKFLVEVFRELGLSDSEIFDFLSGPAFQAWNRFGNIQGSWGGTLPQSWIDSQFTLQKKIVQRMVELGMTPVLPAFTGFVPRAISRVLPGAAIVNGSQWSGFPLKYTNDTFLEPSDPNFTKIQKSFIQKQLSAYGNITYIFTLDQYNENNPFSGDLGYLRNVTFNTWKSLKAADPASIWLMQGWLFFSNSAFWTNDRIKAYLGGVEEDSDMLILDLFSESQPQWQRTDSYFGKPWIWCQVHDYGGNQGIYGQLDNVTINPVQAHNSSSLVGYGLTMEGQEVGVNEIMYAILLDQAWSKSPIDSEKYFRDWVSVRYSQSRSVPNSLYSAWEIMRTTAFNNTNLTSQAVSKSILELSPNITGMVNRTGHHPTTVNYDPIKFAKAWTMMYSATRAKPSLWSNPVFQYDFVDVTRQVMANYFITLYTHLVDSWSSANAKPAAIRDAGSKLLALLSDLDKVLSTNENYLLSKWIAEARSWASGVNASSVASFYEYNARNQITLWGPDAEINDYASKSWGGLISSYYVPRWQIFVDYLLKTTPATYNYTALSDQVLSFGLGWQSDHSDSFAGVNGELPKVINEVRKSWPTIFA